MFYFRSYEFFNYANSFITVMLKKLHRVRKDPPMQLK